MLIADEVQEALDAGKPVVALESTIIAHGLPRPDNLRVAREIEQVVRDNGAVPATIAILGGEVRVGLDDVALSALATAEDVAKCGVRDLPVVCAQGPGRRDDRRRHVAPRRARRHQGLRHRRARRRPSRRARHVRRVRRSRHARAGRDLRRVRGREVDPRHPRHARAPRDAQRHRARLPDGHVPGLLSHELGAAGAVADRLARRGRRGAARATRARARRARSWSRTRSTSNSIPELHAAHPHRGPAGRGGAGHRRQAT